MPVFGNKQPGDAATWEPQVAADQLSSLLVMQARQRRLET